MQHKWYKGKQEQYGNYIYRDDSCVCGCVRRIVLNNIDKQQIESYTKEDSIYLDEPSCTRKKRKVYQVFKTKEKPDISVDKAYKTLIVYIKRQIYYNKWICIKNFYSPEDILMDAYIETKDLEMSLDEFIAVINTILYKEWNKYRQNNPKLYIPYLQKRKKDEQENRTLLLDPYLLHLEQQRIKYHYGITPEYDELRSCFGLIQQVRERVQKHRNKNT